MNTWKIVIPLFIFVVTLFLFPWPGESTYRKHPPVVRPIPLPQTGAHRHSSEDAFSEAVRYLQAHASRFPNKRYITIIDYTRPSSSNRLFVIDLKEAKIQKFPVSHGRNSGWLYATKFSNSPESFKSSRGFFRTGDKYYGKHGPSMELEGLQKGINDNAMSRGIVMHGADYANPRSVFLNHGRLGRSLGCPALPNECAEAVIDKIKGGSLLYIYAKTR